MNDIERPNALPRPNEGVRHTLSVAAAATGLLLSLAAGAFLTFGSCFYVGEQVTPNGGGPGAPLCGSLIEVNGLWVLLILAIPVAVALGGFVAALGGRRAILCVFAVTLMVCVFLGIFSIGRYYVPASVALTVAAVLSLSSKRDPTIFPA